MLTSFPELEGATRKDFFTVFIERVKAQTKPVRKTIKLGLLRQTFSPSLASFLSKNTPPPSRQRMDSQRPSWTAFKSLGGK